MVTAMLEDPSLTTVESSLESGTEQSNNLCSCTSRSYDWRYRMLASGTEPVLTHLGAVARTDLCKGDETGLRVSSGKQV